MTVRWLSCGTGNMHIVETCAGCYGTQGGLLLGTFATGYAGRISAKCVDCGKAKDYYVDSTVGNVWRLEPVESKGVPLEQ
jgi:hypothetical protein